MTRPTRVEIRRVIEHHCGPLPGNAALDQCCDTLLSLFPEGRSEQDHAKTAEAFGHAVEAMRLLEADLSAARLRNKALEAQLARVQPLLSDEDRMHPVGCSTWQSDAFVIDEEITALLSSAQGETKEGFDGLPELPCGEQPGAAVGATAALASPEAGWSWEMHAAPRHGALEVAFIGGLGAKAIAVCVPKARGGLERYTGNHIITERGWAIDGEETWIEDRGWRAYAWREVAVPPLYAPTSDTLPPVTDEGGE